MIVTGKGGVGKSTVSLALALASAAAGKRTIVCEVVLAGALVADLPPREVGFHEVEMAENLWAISIDPDESMREYVLLQLKVKAMRDLLFRSRMFTYLAAATPGLKELVTIGKIWELALDDRKVKRGRRYDLVIVDAPGDRPRGRLPADAADLRRDRPRGADAPAGEDPERVHHQSKAHRGGDRRPPRGDAGERDRQARARPRRGRRGPGRPDLPQRPLPGALRRGRGRAALRARDEWRRGRRPSRRARRGAREPARRRRARAARPARGADERAGAHAPLPLRPGARDREIGALADAVAEVA